MGLISDLINRGFSKVFAFDGSQCGYPEIGSVLLALWRYDADADSSDQEIWIHPYYFASQRAYLAAAEFAREHAQDGVSLRDDIRVKPIFARLPGFSQGRNTLSYLPEFGSRFHVQIFGVTPGIPSNIAVEQSDHALHCGTCRKCEEACPTNALEGGVFHRERCIRNWQMSGKPVPAWIREKMGNRLIGCDVCQQVCPHNSTAVHTAEPTLSLVQLLSDPQPSAALLRPQIGVNLSIPNRVLGQACLIAGCSKRTDLVPVLEILGNHPSPVVADHAQWALEQLQREE